MSQFEIERKVQQELGWTTQQIARSSNEQLKNALKTPLISRIQKESIVTLDCFPNQLKSHINQFTSSSSSSSSSSANINQLTNPLITQSTNQSPSQFINQNPNQNPIKNANEIIAKIQTLKMKYNEKLEFKSLKIAQLEPSDIIALERTIQKNMDELNKVNREMIELSSQLDAQITDKRQLLTLLDTDDLSIPVIKSRIEHLCTQMDILKQNYYKQ